MNTTAIILKDLRKKEAEAVAALNGIRAALAVYGSGNGTEPEVKRTRRKRTLSPEHIAKMQAGRKPKAASLAAAAE